MRPIRTQYASNTHRIRIGRSGLNCWLAWLSAPKSSQASSSELQDRLGMYVPGSTIPSTSPRGYGPVDLGVPPRPDGHHGAHALGTIALIALMRTLVCLSGLMALMTLVALRALLPLSLWMWSGWR